MYGVEVSGFCVLGPGRESFLGKHLNLNPKQRKGSGWFWQKLGFKL